MTQSLSSSRNSAARSATLDNSSYHGLPARGGQSPVAPWQRLLEPLASLKLTVILLVLAMLLIFAGTTVQRDLGIWDTQERYFYSFFTFIEWKLFFPLWGWAVANMKGGIPFPGGYTIVALLLVNLLAAHTLRFKYTIRRAGIVLIHAGLILLIGGEVFTSIVKEEGQMMIDVGGSSNYTYDTRQVELAVIDPSPADHDNITVIPGGRLVHKGIVQNPVLPFSIRINEFYPNSEILGPMQAGERKNARATAGAGIGLTLVSRPKFGGTESMSDMPAAYVTPIGEDGQPLGTYLVSTMPLGPPFPAIDQPQEVKVGGKTYRLHLRYQREYKPYTVHLLSFTHDKYVGTDIPKDFASEVRLVDPGRNVDRTVRIWMNHPLRYNGETFYQASFKPGDQTSILQVVRNPGWLLPYISCTMVGLGMVVHFGATLTKFLKKRRAVERGMPVRGTGASPVRPQKEHGRGAHATVDARPRAGASLWFPALVTAAATVYLFGLLRPPANNTGFDAEGFSRLPVSYEGRTMPLDSLARNSLRIISGRSELRTDAGTLPAMDWLIDVFSHPEKSESAKVFRITHPDILSLLGLDQKRKLFSAAEILGPATDAATTRPSENARKLQDQAILADRTDAKQRDPYQKQILELYEHLTLYAKLTGVRSLFIAPPLEPGQHWASFDQAMHEAEKHGQPNPGAAAFLAAIQAHHDNDSGAFNSAVADYRSLLDEKLPALAKKLDTEILFNRAEPFYQGMILYVIIFLLAVFSWLKWHGPLSRAALWLLILTLIFHTVALITRVYLQGRPPVTNLYSSAIFIAWAAVLFCVGLELIYRNGVASAAAASLAFPSLLIAHYLAGDGDTMRMLQAVLDTNFWLATHVVVITLGYSATFLAGFIALAYVLGGVLTPSLSPERRKDLARMVYGIVCFAMLFSFVGTILGGIWADQSWGRFWGWDPKENGAVLIVIWNAIILHARWGGIIRERGLMLLAICGNIVTSWSWFGTNMLGIGLHSYGFMDSAVFWLSAFVASQLFVIALGSLPLELWRSHRAIPNQEAAAPGGAV